MVRWIPDSQRDEEEMLRAIGLTTSDELYSDVPRKARIGRLGIGTAQEEGEAVRAVDKILDRNRPFSRFANFLGGRFATRYFPAAVDSILQRSEFYTSYTPYQAEASQGMLQALFEFQSLWVELTGLDVANASLYDGATASGEALLLARRVHEGRRFLVPASLPWEERSVLSNYATGPGLTVVEIPFEERTGLIDLGRIAEEVRTGDVFGVLADVPNGFGHLDDHLFELRSTVGDLPLIVRADPLALTVLEPPAHYGADIVVGEGQSFGIPPSYGGPGVGLFACRKDFVRLSPGRIVGATHDKDGRRAYALTLQTREQHIRRSRATSNICTNESLIALAFVVYASVVGPRGLAELQRGLAEKARTIASALAGLDGLRSPRFEAPYLSDFTIELARGTASEFLERLRKRGVLGGVPLRDPRPGAPNQPERILVSATETVDDRAIAKLVSAATPALAAMGGSK